MLSCWLAILGKINLILIIFCCFFSRMFSCQSCKNIWFRNKECFFPESRTISLNFLCFGHDWLVDGDSAVPCSLACSLEIFDSNNTFNDSTRNSWASSVGNFWEEICVVAGSYIWRLEMCWWLDNTTWNLVPWRPDQKVASFEGSAPSISWAH